MKKKLIFIFFFLINLSFAQKELWGVYKGYPSYTGANDVVVPANYGNITKYDINGENPVIMHGFNEADGKAPLGRLFLASNGKLYGTCSQGGLTIPTFLEGYGVIYEYDLILNKFRVVKYLYGYDKKEPNIGLIEPIQGILYGTTDATLYTYNLNSDVTTFYGSANNLVNSELMKASDGNLYGTTIFPPQNCPDSSPSSPPYNGSIIKINTTNNTISTVYDLSCNWAFGAKPSGELVEVSPGKLYGTTLEGGVLPNTAISNYGVIFEYNFLTNTYTKKFDFDYVTTGTRPGPLLKGLNGNLYGGCVGGGTCTFSSTEGSGTLFEFNPTTNVFSTLKTFGCGGNLIANPGSLMKASTGNFFGTVVNAFGVIFKYNLIDNTCSVGTSPKTDNLIEICRKPSYQEILVNSFTVATGANFTYDVQNTNATSYQWQLGGATVVGQTTGVLNITNATTANAGNYTCIMTNECGTTTTAPLTLNVNNLGVNNVGISLIGIIKLYPNPTNTFINIELPKNINVTINEVKINDILGKEIFYKKENKNKIDVSSLVKGIYIVSIKTNYGGWNGKFVKE